MNQEVLFAGCAAHSLAGRSDQVKKYDGVEETNVLTFSRIFAGVSIAKVVAGNTASHFFLLGTDGHAYGFGRNEDGQVNNNSNKKNRNVIGFSFEKLTTLFIF